MSNWKETVMDTNQQPHDLFLGVVLDDMIGLLRAHGRSNVLPLTRLDVTLTEKEAPTTAATIEHPMRPETA